MDSTNRHIDSYNSWGFPTNESVDYWEFGTPLDAYSYQSQYQPPTASTSILQESSSESLSDQSALLITSKNYDHLSPLASSRQDDLSDPVPRSGTTNAPSTSQLSSLDAPESPSRRRYTSERWREVQSQIQKYYIQQGLSLRKTMEMMKDYHGFYASYISRNNIRLATY